jgi:hypothetical protein
MVAELPVVVLGSLFPLRCSEGGLLLNPKGGDWKDNSGQGKRWVVLGQVGELEIFSQDSRE